MGTRLKCRDCDSKADTTNGELASGWNYTKADAEMADARGKPTCPQCSMHYNILSRRKLYDD